MENVINVNFDIHDVDKELKDKITSLHLETKEPCSREQILSECVKELDLFLHRDDRFIVEHWGKLCAHNNTELSFHDFNNQIIKGKFMGIDEKGRAMIETNGKINYYLNGVIEL